MEKIPEPSHHAQLLARQQAHWDRVQRKTWRDARDDILGKLVISLTVLVPLAYVGVFGANWPHDNASGVVAIGAVILLGYTILLVAALISHLRTRHG